MYITCPTTCLSLFFSDHSLRILEDWIKNRICIISKLINQMVTRWLLTSFTLDASTWMDLLVCISKQDDFCILISGQPMSIVNASEKYDMMDVFCELKIHFLFFSCMLKVKFFFLRAQNISRTKWEIKIWGKSTISTLIFWGCWKMQFIRLWTR